MRGGQAWRFSISVFAVAAGLPLAAAAQQQGSAPSIQPGARVTEVDVIGQIIYDSNVTGSNTAVAAARRLSPSDVIFEPRISFVIARPVGRETFYVQGDTGYDFHLRDTLLNRENIDIRPGVIGRIGICQSMIDGEYSRAQSDLDELARSPTGLPTRLQEKNVFQVEQIGGNATCGRAVGLAPSFTASEAWVQNSSLFQRFSNSQTFSGSGGLTYQRPVLGSLRLFGAFSQTDFPNRVGLPSFEEVGVATGYKTYSGGVTYVRAVGSRLQGSASVSYTKLDEQGVGHGFSGATYSAALIYQFSTRLGASTNVSRATVPSSRLNSTYGIDELYSEQLNYQLSSRLMVSGGASYAHNNYNGIPFSRGGFDITDEKYYTAFSNVNYQLTRRLSLGAHAEQRQRNANFPGLSYPDTRLGLMAQATF